MMQNQRLTMVLLIVAMCALVPVATSAAEVHTQGGVSYVSGGAGTEERDELDAMSGRFNLKITMAISNGEYVGNASVRIVDAKGQPVVEAVAEGPFFYAQLPAGDYSVAATVNGKEQKQKVHVGSGGQQQVKLTWASE
jgi:hypothetical protein